MATTKVGTLGQVANAQLRPTFNSIMDQVLSQDAMEIARTGLNRTLAEMHVFNKDNNKKSYKNLQNEIQPGRPQNTAQQANHDSSQTLHSLPDVDLREFSTRLAPMGSPSRQNSKGRKQAK